MRKAWFLSIMVTVMFAVGGCDEEQLGQADKIVTDANDIVGLIKEALESPPARAFLPADIQLYGAVGIALASMVLNGWQEVKGSLMKKTTKAIVKGIEKERKACGDPNPTDPIKNSIKTEMQLAGIYDRANVLVDKLKISR